MASTPVSEASDGPVLNLINKRIRALKKKLNRIHQMEESISKGKPINKEQQEVLKSKPSLLTIIDELEKLRIPLSAAVSEEMTLAQRHQHTCDVNPERVNKGGSSNLELEDVLNVIYFASLFDVKSQNDFTSTMLTRTHERGCCLTYDYVTDDDHATDLLGEKDLDLISRLGGLLVSRPGDFNLSHKNALQRCVEHAGLWVNNSELPIEPDVEVTYAGLREKLRKIMASDYFTITPQMKAPVEMAATNYVPYQVPAHTSMVPMSVPVQVEDSGVQSQQKEEATDQSAEHETGDNQPSPPEEIQKGGVEMENPEETVSVQIEEAKVQKEVGHNHGEVEYKEEQYNPRGRTYNQRSGRGGGGGGGGRRGYTNSRSGRGNGRDGSQNFDQSGNYYPRNYNNNKGGRGYNNRGPGAQGGYSQADVVVSS